MRLSLAVLTLLFIFFLTSTTGQAQSLPRTFGVRSLMLDDGTGSGKSLQLQVRAPILTSYTLRFPMAPPQGGVGYLAVDPQGNAWWQSYMSLPPLARGHLWCGDANGWAWEMPPGPTGTILTVDATSMPSWSSTISASIISSGVLKPGVTITVGNGAQIIPTGSGQNIANDLTGSGPNKYAGSVPIQQFALSMMIPYAQITSGSTVLVTVSDPSGQTDGVTVTGITPGVGFTVAFAGYYPTTSGNLNYIVAR